MPIATDPPPAFGEWGVLMEVGDIGGLCSWLCGVQGWRLRRLSPALGGAWVGGTGQALAQPRHGGVGDVCVRGASFLLHFPAPDVTNRSEEVDSSGVTCDCGAGVGCREGARKRVLGGVGLDRFPAEWPRRWEP